MTKAAAEHGPHETGVAGAREAGGPRAFAHLRVLDLSEKLSGAYAARMFADFGADVILAEPEEGHPLRDEPPFVDDRPGLDRSVMHGYANWNKRSVVSPRCICRRAACRNGRCARDERDQALA